MLTAKLKAIPLDILNDNSSQPLEKHIKDYSQGWLFEWK
jgi:hypothetical protein